MFGRQITRSGWLKLAALAVGVAVFVFLISAPLMTISVKVDLPPATGAQEPTPLSDWLQMFAWIGGFVAGLFLLIICPCWLIIRTATKIIQREPKRGA